MNINSPTSERSLKSKEKQRIALVLRKSGASYKEISEKVGCSIKQATTYVKKAIEEHNANNAEVASDIINLELSRLDQMLMAISTQVKQGHLGSIDRALKIQERRAKLLGLDKPAKFAQTDAEGQDLYNPDIIKNKLINLIERRFAASEETVESIDESINV